MPNTFGHLFSITTWGESHGGGVGVVVDGCPPRIPLTEADVQVDLDRRRPGQSKIVTPRKESDTCQILSGTFEGRTLGTPISIWVRNEDQRAEAYKEMETLFRPSHADYGIRNWQGGGRASARETIGRVAGGAVAQQVFKKFLPKLEIVAFVSQVHELTAQVPLEKISYAEVEGNIVRWPDSADSERVVTLIEKARSAGDSLGGVVTCLVRNAPVGLGEPVFDKLEADLAKAMLSLPASKGFEIGSGFAGTLLKGSEHNDAFVKEGDRVRTLTNRARRDFQRRGHHFPGRVQAGGDDCPGAADRHRDGRSRRAKGARPPRSLRAAPRRAHGRGDDAPRAGGSLDAAAGRGRRIIIPVSGIA